MMNPADKSTTGREEREEVHAVILSGVPEIEMRERPVMAMLPHPELMATAKPLGKTSPV